MNNSETIEATSQEAVQVKLAAGEYTVTPLTVRRSSKLVALLRDVQGDPAKLNDMSNPDFNQAIVDMLMAAGDKMPRALSLFAGDERLEKLEDVSLLDLAAVVLAAAKANKASLLLESFHRATKMFNGKAEQE